MLIDKDSLIINDTKIAQYLISVHFGYHKIWSSDSGRTLSGDNKGSLKGIYPKITMTFRKLNEEEIAILLNIFNKAEQKVTFYNPDLKKTIYEASFYSNDQEFDQTRFGRVKNYSASVISNKRREYYANS